MRDYNVSLDDYTSYLMTLQKSIFKILPLYEEENAYLFDYINSTIDKVIFVKEIIEPLPHGDWYVDVLGNLRQLESLSKLSNSHKKIRKLMFESTGLIQTQINNINKRMWGNVLWII